MRPLSELIIRACDPLESSINRVKRAINFIVPWLLDKGLLESSQDILGFNFNVLLRVIKVSGVHLKVYIVRTIGMLVEAMSALEPRALQYLEFHTHTLNISAEDYESTRLRLAEDSPMQKSLEGCLKSLGPESVIPTMAILRDAIQFGVGLTTKVSAARSITLIAERYPECLGTEGASIFSSIIHTITRSPPRYPGLMSAIMSSIRQLAKVIHSEYIAQACQMIIKDYYLNGTASEECRNALAGIILQIVGASAGKDIGRQCWLETLLVAYVGSFDIAANVADTWCKVFQESLQASCLGDKVSILSLICSQILDAGNVLLWDLNWRRRSQAIAMLADLFSLVPIENSNRVPALFLTLLRQLPGQIWSGQDRILDNLATLTCKCRKHYDYSLSKEVILVIGESKITSETLLHETHPVEVEKELIGDSWSISLRGVMNLFLHEARRGDSDYRLAAVIAMTSLSRSFNGIENQLVLVDTIEEVTAFLHVANSQELCATTGGELAPKLKSSTHRSAFDIFGSRYGIELSNKKCRPLGHSNASSSFSENLETPKELPVSSANNLLPPVRLQIDPALRVKMLEFIAHSWPMSRKDGELDPHLASRKGELVMYLKSAAVNEIWSIRRAALTCLSAIINFNTDKDDVHEIAKIIEGSLNEKKYSLVRRSAIECLRSLVVNADIESWRPLKQDIRKLLMLGVADNQPDVARLAGDLQVVFTEMLN